MLFRSVLVVHPSVPVRSVRDLLALAKARPGALTHGSSGTGAPGHLSGEVLKMMTGTSFLHVPYKGSSLALVDLLGGHIDMVFPTIPAGIQHIRSGRLRALAVTGARRSVSLPEVPTVAESGVPGYEVVGWYGVLAPAALPRPILGRLNSEIQRMLKSPDVRERLLREGGEPAGNTPEEFAAYLAADVGKWAKVVKGAGIRLVN